MYLEVIRIKNFRRLVDVRIDLDRDISIFVGANNSGKTSVAQAMHFFVSGVRDRAAFHDISACRWNDIDDFGDGNAGAALPVLSLDLWFAVGQADLHRVVDLLPSLDWQGSRVGVRIEFAPRNESGTLAHFNERRERARENAGENMEYVAPLRSLREFLEGEFKKEYEFKYFVLDQTQFDDDLDPNQGYEPQELFRDQGRAGKDIVNSLIKIDFLHAQRHLSDSEGGSRAQELSKHLSRFYQRNLQRYGDDYNAVKALADSESNFNQHLKRVFSNTLQRLALLGYPGLSNPRLMIKSALNPATVMSSHDGAHVHYALNDEGLTLPDRYSGLGFKNLIYMVVELLDLHAQWLGQEDKCPPLHLAFIEEPEAHLHVQLQQVFVKKVLEILTAEGEAADGFHTQLALTTHSPHILYERGFRPIRYFRREGIGAQQATQVLNLSKFYRDSPTQRRDFLDRYLKLSHCDIFFADAAILVEGNVERLLLPQMIANSAPALQSCYLCTLEIGGAHAHVFRPFIEFLGIATLIITDLDSVSGHGEADQGHEEGGGAQSVCMPETPGAITSNQVLAQWLPEKTEIDELLAAVAEEKCVQANHFGLGGVRVTYPCTVKLSYGDEEIRRAGRTFEVAFALDNLSFTQHSANTDLRLCVHEPGGGLDQLAQRLHEKVHSSNFKKTDFALALLAKNPDSWNVPEYIAEGLRWLESTLDIATNEGDQPEGGGQ